MCPQFIMGNGPSNIQYNLTQDQNDPYVDADSIGEWFIALEGTLTEITPANPAVLYTTLWRDGIMGNIIIKNCFIRNSGIGRGSVLFRDKTYSRYFYNIIASENIVVSSAPAQTVMAPIMEVLDLTDVSAAALNDVIEVNNITLDDDII